MNNVKNSLTRKFGPLPAWAWFLGLFLVIYFYRRYRGTATTASGTGTGSVAPASGPPQAQQVLQPGESVYDPNTGAMMTAPGGGSTSVGAANDLGAAMDNLAGAIASGMPPTQVNVSLPSVPTAGKTPTSGAKTKSHGSVKRAPKHKIKRGKGVTKPHKPANKPVTRSTAHVRTRAGGRTNVRQTTVAQHPTQSHGQHPATHGNPGQPSRSGAPAPPRVRQKPRTPAVTTTTQQRRPAQMPRPAPRGATHPAPRPSAPPPRTQRTPATRPTPRPASRRRK